MIYSRRQQQCSDLCITFLLAMARLISLQRLALSLLSTLVLGTPTALYDSEDTASADASYATPARRRVPS